MRLYRESPGLGLCEQVGSHRLLVPVELWEDPGPGALGGHYRGVVLPVQVEEGVAKHPGAGGGATAIIKATNIDTFF